MREKGRERLALGAAILLTAVLALLSVRVGSYPLSTGQILDILSGGLAGTTPAHVLWNLRLPRVGMGLLAGWALGMAGGVYQTVFRNPLASPDLTGVASGASFGAAWAIVLGAGTSLQIMGGAFIMGSLSLLLVLALVRWAGMERTGAYILAGVIVSSAADAGLMVLKTIADPEGELAAIEFWTMGSLSAMTGDKLRGAASAILIPLALLLLFGPHPLPRGGGGPRPGAGAPAVAGAAAGTDHPDGGGGGLRGRGDRFSGPDRPPHRLSAAGAAGRPLSSAVRPDGGSHSAGRRPAGPGVLPGDGAPAEHLDRAVRGPGAHRTASSGKGGEPMSALLEVQGLTAGYRRPVICDISFALRPGEITAVLGRNGCGKTTLLRSLTGGARILSGTVWAAGEDCLDWSARRRARSIALLSQHSQLLPGLWAEEVIAMGRTPWLGPLSGPGPEDRAMVRAAAERFGVAELLDRDCAQLSEGQRQLVHLARLAVQDAPILLLDEPNSALDFENTGLLFRRVRELVETGERTALIVLHDPALALRWCRRLLLLAGGRLVDNVATEGMGAEALQAVLRQLYPTIQVRRDESGRFYCLPD
mgnify:CR=1 FL=1